MKQDRANFLNIKEIDTGTGEQDDRCTYNPTQWQHFQSSLSLNKLLQ